MNEFERVARAAAAIEERGGGGAKLALVLGSGLGAFADEVSSPVVIPYDEIPEFPAPSVPGHSGRLVVGELGGVRVAILAGRVHHYEGYSAAEVVRPLRTLITLGAKAALVTNASGGIHAEFVPGDLMLITDHLNLTGTSPLCGPIERAWPIRFVDMGDAYDPALTGQIEAAGREQGVPLQRGVYAGLAGGAYETPAEVRMLRTMGADAVGMSTVLEVLAARHLGAKIAGISCITNYAAGIGSEPLSHADVEQTAARVRQSFAALLRASIPRLGALL